MDSDRCVGEVYNGYHVYQCQNKGKVERGGKRFCGVHDPQTKIEKEAARKRQRLLGAAARAAAKHERDCCDAVVAAAKVWRTSVEGHSTISLIFAIDALTHAGEQREAARLAESAG